MVIETLKLLIIPKDITHFENTSDSTNKKKIFDCVINFCEMINCGSHNINIEIKKKNACVNVTNN